MKKFYTFAISLVVTAGAIAQTESTHLMSINLKNGSTINYNISDIKDITFSEETAKDLPVAVTIPTDFSKSYVQKVMAGGKQVAEIDKEYVKGLGQVTVIYPCGSDGKPDLTKGIETSTGVSVSWDASTNLPTVGTQGGAIEKIYVVEGALVTEYSGDTQDAVIVEDVLSDRRGTELQTYRIVKIGLQYWLADNLRTTKYADGSDIAAFSENQADAWHTTTEGAYLIDTETDWVAIAGLLYNGYVATSDKIAPEGWRMPTCADYGKIRTSVGERTAAIYRDSAPGTWGEDITCTNLTGFSVVATGYFSKSTGFNAMFSDTYIWTSDHAYDALARAEAADFFRVNTGANAVFPTKGLSPHSYNFGHCIRLVRE